MNRPYIGVTDFTSREQVQQAWDCIPPWVDRRLHVGAMMSYKTLHNIPTASGWENIWLNEYDMQQLFQDSERDQTFNVLHYADYPDENGKVHTTHEDVIEALRIAGPGVHGIQLDMIWPNGKILLEIKDKFPHVETIMQVSSRAIGYAVKHGMLMAEVLECYPLDCLDYILIDFGMGRGTPFDPNVALQHVNDALKVLPERKIAVAGGLGPDTYTNLECIFEKYPDISCDAQGQLRSSGSAKDPIEMDRVIQYVNGVCSLL